MSSSEVFSPSNGPLMLPNNLAYGPTAPMTQGARPALPATFSKRTQSRPSTQGNGRFGQLSYNSFFARHSPHPGRVRHIKGEVNNVQSKHNRLIQTFYISFGTHIWDPHTDSNTLKLETVQRRSARRIMQNYNRHASVTTMLQHIDLRSTLQQRRRHSKIIMLYRIRHQLANIPTTTYITPATRNTQHYNLPYARTDVYKSSFFPSTIKLWNKLQPAIINSTTIPQLRQAL